MPDHDRVDLIPLARRYLPDIRRFLLDDDLRAHVGTTLAPSEAEHERWYERATSDPTQCVRVIVDHTDEALGTCGLRTIDLVNGTTELWLYVAKQKRKGVGRAAVRQLLKIAFEDLRLHRVAVRVFGFNHGAHEFFLSAGFTDEGIDREAVFRRGRYHDVWRMATTAPNADTAS